MGETQLNVTDLQTRLDTLDQAVAAIAQRLTLVEERLQQLAHDVSGGHAVLRRTVDMKTARTGEMSSRIAQRIAKLESAVELLSRTGVDVPADADGVR